ncbi:MAG: pyridoxal phosphate-dependent aminotransferase [Lachnospiraceae bacterium]|nr:pyridoxal phosphate-dependent aminotransferase [Lachnospiraceae bacterium]
MISEKMRELVANGSAIRAMFEEGKKMAAEFGAENVYDYSLGNPSVAPPKEVNDAIKEVLNEDPVFLHGYMNNSGYDDVRQSVAESLNRRFETNFFKRNILMTVGAAGGLNVILKTLLNPGDEVIVFAPFFGEYKNYVDNFQGKLVVVDTEKETFQPNLEDFMKKITDKTKAVIINNPNNPTGVIYEEKTIMAISEILYKAQNAFDHSIYIISDEPYRELVYTDVEVPYLTKYYENTIVGYSFSKSLSLPGERIGYLVMPDELDGADEIIDGANIANRVLGFVNAPSLMQRVIQKVLDVRVDVSVYDKNRELLYNSLSDYGFEMAKPQGAFYMFMKSMEEDDKAFCQKAKEHHLLLVPGSSFGCPGYVRLAYCVDYDMIKRSLPAFEKLAKEYQ